MTFHELYFQFASGGKLKASDYGFYAVEVPYPGAPEVKEPYKNDWYDEDGDDEYIPSSPKFKSFEFEVTLAYNGQAPMFADSLYLLLSDLKREEFAFYSVFGHWGRKDVRYVSYTTDAYHFDDVFIFKLKFKVNDPVTAIGIYQRQDTWELYEEGRVI